MDVVSFGDSVRFFVYKKDLAGLKREKRRLTWDRREYIIMINLNDI